MAEPPLVKPDPKFVNQMQKIIRPISSGYELKQDIAPEIKRNLPSEIPENKKQGLNINAPLFIPKGKHLVGNEKKKDYPGNNFNNYYPQQYMNNMNNIPYMNSMNNMNNMSNMSSMNSNSYYNQYYYPNNTYQKQFQNQPGFYPPNFSSYVNNNMQNQYNNQYRNKHNMNTSDYNKNQNSQKTPLTNSYNTQTFNKQANKSLIPLKPTENSFIPKSMRETTNKPAEDVITNLNTNAPEYTPQNVSLKKKEEEIKKMKEKEKEKEEKAEKKEEKETKEAKENVKNEEKTEEQKQNKESQKEDEKKNKANDENNSEHRNKSNLFKLLESNDNDNAKKSKPKEKAKHIGNDKSENTQSYKNNKKKQKTLVDQKIDQVNTKGKRLKEEEERKKEEERKRKEEEEKIRREEEKKRKEEERKRREEEERKREEEEKRKREEEEERRKAEEERRKQLELEEQKRKEEEEKNKVIEKKYFIVFKNRKSEKKEYKYTFEYIMQFKNWKISKEDELLTNSVKQHFKDFEEEEREGGKRKKNEGKINKNRSSAPEYSQQPKTGLTNNETPANSMEKWARKDMTKEIKAAEEFKQKLEETIKDDPIKRNLRNFLNMLTKDNYDKIKQNIIDTIKEKVEYQEKFLDVLFQKAVSERAYVELYARLCRKKKETSVMRGKLLDKCKEIFTIENNEKFDEYIKEKDPEERENKLKKFVLGNVYFITELIKIKILSKKIAPVCIKNLFKRYEKEEGDEKLKLINIQAIVIFTDQFGTLVHSQEKKIISKDAEEFKKSIDEIFQKLDKVKDEKGLPGYIKYKIINLIEKRKSGYQKSKLEEYRTAKSKKEVIQELENQDQITQDNINDKIKGGLEDYRDFVEEEGSSAKYPWKETTYLYDKKEKGLDDILEGYIVSCGDFIEKENNIKYAKDYIKELIEYYSDKIKKKEKKDLRIRLFNLLEIVRDYALETPQIYDIYAYVISIFIDSNIMEISDLEEIIKEKDSNEKDLKVVSDILEKAYNYYKGKIFREELSKFNYIKNNTELFKWVYNSEETEENNDD